MTAAASVDGISTPAVESVMAPLCRTEPSIGDVRRVLRLLGKHKQISVLVDELVPEGGNPDVREARALGVIQAMCWQAEYVLSRLHEAVQDAPLDGLNEAIRETSSWCKSPKCSGTRYPWQDEFCDGPTCRAEYAAAMGPSHADVSS